MREEGAEENNWSEVGVVKADKLARRTVKGENEIFCCTGRRSLRWQLILWRSKYPFMYENQKKFMYLISKTHKQKREECPFMH